MQLSVTFRHMEPSDALKEYAQEKISRVKKYLDSPVEAHVVMSVEKFRHTADVTITSDGFKINGQEETGDMYSAIDMVVDKLERQVKRLRQKNKNRKPKNRTRGKEVEAAPADSETVAETDVPDQTIHIRQVFVKPMDLDEAVMQLEISLEHFLVFTDAATEKINVLYRRDDGDYDLIEPVSG